MLEHRLAPAAGDLDLTFGTGGKVLTDLPSSENFYTQSLAIQADRKIVVVGHTYRESTNLDFALVRYNADGSLDETFGSGGQVITDFGSEDGATSVAVQSGGRIVVAGFSYAEASGYDFAVARYNADGTLDTSFDGDGKLTVDFFPVDDEAFGVAVQSDGRIVVAGYTNAADNGYDFALMRLNADGNLDTTFGVGGMVTTDFGPSDFGSDRAYGVALQQDGKIVVAGYNGDFALARYNTDGSLDTNFGGDGKVTTDFGSGDLAFGIALQQDGKIVVAGNTSDFSPSSPSFDRYDFAVARYNADGSLDTSFDAEGRVRTDFGEVDGYGTQVAVQPDGKVVVAGHTLLDGIRLPYFGAVRYNSNGSLDATFDGDGKVTTDFGGFQAAFPTGIGLQLDGKIVLAGVSLQGNSGTSFALARYHGATDTDGDGIADSVDNQPTVFSNAFSDGTTFGTITARGDQTFTIVDAPNPSKGLVINAELSGGAIAATVELPCTNPDPNAILSLTAGDQVIATCGSVILDVRAGPIEATFLADSGQVFTANLPAGNVLIFEPEAGTFTAPSTNPVTIVVAVGGMQMPVAPGASILAAQIDIKPGTHPNSINLGSNGSVPVAILSTPTFNATTVNPLTVTLAGAGVNLRGNGTPQASEQDVNGDGRLDLVVHVATEALELTSGDVTAVLHGQTYGGLAIQGSDTVRVIDGLHAAAAGPGYTGPALTQAEAQAMARHALQRWAGSQGRLRLPRVSVVVADLPGNVLGMAVGNVINVDDNAAGWGWFVDRTPRSDSEFTRPGNQGEKNRMDLLTVLMHEVGHLLGHEHDESGVMAETLAAGVRRSPSAGGDAGWLIPIDGLSTESSPKKRK